MERERARGEEPTPWDEERARDGEAPAPWDEERERDGTVRPLYERTLLALEACDLAALRRAVDATLADRGVTFGGVPFVVDPVPRLIAANEWAALEAGLAQRMRALNAFLRDVYGERRIVRAGVVDAAVIERAEGYEPQLAGRIPPAAAPAAIIGFDLVRTADGGFLVLEDNLRTPSGIAYMGAARAALETVLPSGLPRPRPVEPDLYALLAETLRAAAPPQAGPDPLIVVLTDGPANVAYYEHARIAEALAVPLLTPDDLVRDGDALVTQGPDGERRTVDVVYRRTDEDRAFDEHGEPTAIGALLCEPWCRGRIGLVNAFGNGVADDKLVHGHVEDFVRFYCGEEPLVRSVPTLTLDTPRAREQVLGRLDRLVVKPRHGHGGSGVTIGSVASEEELGALADALRRQPERYIAQPIVPLSRHPTVIDGRLEPRHVDLRPFGLWAKEPALAPGGLSRVAFGRGDMIVNSSRNGGGKDTWVLD